MNALAELLAALILMSFLFLYWHMLGKDSGQYGIFDRLASSDYSRGKAVLWSGLVIASVGVLAVVTSYTSWWIPLTGDGVVALGFFAVWLALRGEILAARRENA